MKTKYYVIFSVLIPFLTYYMWFFSFATLYHGDWGFYNPISQKELLNLPTIWSNTGLGSVNIGASFYPTNVFWGILGHIFSYGISERIIFLWPSVLFAGPGSFLLFSKWLKYKPAAFVGSLVYAYNGYFMILRSGDLTIGVMYSIAPFIILSFVEALERRKLIYSILSGLICFVGSIYEFRIFYIISWVLISYLLFSFILNTNKKSYFVVILKYSLPIFLTVILLNIYWLVGILKINDLTSNAIFSRGLWGGQYYNISEAITLFHPFWSLHGPTIFSQQSLPLYYWIIPVLVVAGLYLNRRKPIALFFGYIGILGILLTKQQGLPFTGLYLWLYSHFPGFNAYREASKFYGLIALSYGLLIGMLIDWVINNWREGYSKKILLPVFVVCVSALFLINLKPLITGEMGSLYVARSMPEDYEKLNKFISGQNNYFRTLWMPTFSTWGYYSDLHPELSLVSEMNSDWSGLQGIPTSEIDTSSLSTYSNFFSQSYFHNIIDLAGIKYLIVPLRDVKNDDDFFTNYDNNRQDYIQLLRSLPWLKQINIGMNSVLVFENTTAIPYFTTSTNMATFPNQLNINNLYNFTDKTLHKNVTFDQYKSNSKFSSLGVQDIFATLQPKNFSDHTIKPTIQNLTTGSDSAYINTIHPVLSYVYSKNILNLSDENSNKFDVNNQPIGKDIPWHVIYTSYLDPTKNYYVNEGVNLYDAKLAGNQYLGRATSNVNIFESSNYNLVPNVTFKSGLWQKKVTDCNDYDDHPEIGMSRDKIDSNITHFSLLLSAGKHISCTGPNPISVSSGSYYRFAFTYKVSIAKQAGYLLTFNNSSHTHFEEQLPAEGEWTPFSRLIRAPDGASKVSIQLMGYPDEELKRIALTNYYGVQLIPLSSVSKVPITINPDYVKVPININTKLNYDDNSFTYKNLIPNGSLKEGLWQQKVGDCNNYDNKPIIGMQLDKKLLSGGQNVLELDATRHTACTGPNPVKVEQNTEVYFSFRYQSPNAVNAGYNVSFNDPLHTNISQQLQITDTKWQTFSTTITVPQGATQLSLNLYSYSADPSDINVITRYSNLDLYLVPDIQDTYYLLSLPEQQFVSPNSISYKLVSATKKIVTITGATTPFYLNMDEAYNTNWRLEINNKNVHGLNNWLFTAKPNLVPTSDHYDLDNFANGWYVDTKQLCKMQDQCTQNKDGSYNISFEIEFAPQRYFYIGGIISGVTLVVCSGYLATHYIKRSQRVK
jgi:hypothetical protein